jgi:diguanylate cyclase (GGDEF)-like protein
MNERKKERKITLPTLQTAAFAGVFILLATQAGVMARGPWLPLALLSVAFAGLGLWAAGRDWLTRPDLQSSPRQRIRMLLVIAASFLFSLGYVWLTGGTHSPLAFALYLPLVLASVCFGGRAGVATALGMMLIYMIGLGWANPQHLPLRGDWAGALSFPLVAVTISLLTKRNEERLIALHRHNRELDTLLDISQMMDAAINLEMMLNLVLLNVQQLSNCQVCAIYLKDAAGDTLELRNVTAPGRYSPLRPTIAMSELDPRQVGALRLDPQARSWASFPLTCVEGTIGLLYISDDRARILRPEDTLRVKQLAARAGFPIQRAMTQEDTEALAYSDAMTGLDNYRQFERTLQDEMRRAERYHRPVSLLMLDIDHFKQFNDSLGHPAGDALLAQLGMVLRNALRSVDHPARYGGEEFAAILPETGPEEAHLIAERIRQSVAETAFLLTDSPQKAAQVTVSIGYATAPQDAHAASDLIKRADAALYEAKRAGRNAVRGPEESETRLLAA